MTLQTLPQTFTVCKVPEFSAELLRTPFCFTAATDTEYSLVCPVSAVPQNCTERADGWRGLRVEGTLDFALIGVLARLTALLAEHAVSVFAVSTYDTDYLFVREAQWSDALNALGAGGYEIRYNFHFSVITNPFSSNALLHEKGFGVIMNWERNAKNISIIYM